MKLVCDVSGSMYRFNGYDGRLDREMEAMVMVMEGLEGYEHKIKVRNGDFLLASEKLSSSVHCIFCQ